jgi:hypothetical protein
LTEEAVIEQAKAQQRVTNAFHRVFTTEDGKAVMEHLRSYFRADRPAFEKTLGHRFDTIAAAIRDGQREVLLYIEHRLQQPAKGDADIEKAPTKVLR